MYHKFIDFRHELIENYFQVREDKGKFMATTLVEQTYDALMQMIMNQNYGPGDRLPSENTLCEDLGVSRNTLRAALNKLSALGFTESRQGGGTYLRAVEPGDFMGLFIPLTLSGKMDLLDILQFKRGIESEAASLAATKATDEDIAYLKECCEQCKSESEGAETGVLSDGNINFHSAVAKATHNVLYIKINEIIDLMLQAVASDWRENEGDIDGSFYHGMIVRSIENRKPDEAEFFMQRHLSLIIDYVAESKRQAEEQAKA